MTNCAAARQEKWTAAVCGSKDTSQAPDMFDMQQQ